jgi:cytochrome c oxidase subunit IV
MNRTRESALVPFAVYIALIVLLLITWGAAYVNLGPWNNVVALAVAVTKGLLILLFFMELRVSRKATWLAAAAGFVWLGILLVLSGSDYITRGVLHIAGK